MLTRATFQALAVGGAIVALEACTAMPVHIDVNPSMSVASCHTYVFADEHVANTDQASPFGNPLNADRLRTAVEYNLATKGIQKVANRRTAECVVGYAMGTRQVFDDYYGGFGVGWGWGGWGRRGFGGFSYDGFAYDGPFVRDETRISIDVFDAKSRIPIWHASVSQSVADLNGPNAVAKINLATSAIFAKFPPAGMPVAAGSPAAT